jgi:predicted aspartyl protease
MKTKLLTFVALLALRVTAFSVPSAGFFLPDSIQEVTFKYRSVDNLIILPVIINGTIRVNLILDTGCRNVVLFGKQFKGLFATDPMRRVEFNGLGAGKAVVGSLSLDNTVSIDAVTGNRIPIIIVENKNLFARYPAVHGIIGYEIFSKFEVMLNFAKQVISFRPGASACLPTDFDEVPLRIDDSRPFIPSKVITNAGESNYELLVDTGSTLGLLITTSDKKHRPSYNNPSIGVGLNGIVRGVETLAREISISNTKLKNISTGIIYSTTHEYASIGIGALKDYILVLNYSKSYAGLKRNA